MKITIQSMMTLVLAAELLSSLTPTKDVEEEILLPIIKIEKLEPQPNSDFSLLVQNSVQVKPARSLPANAL